MIERRVIVGLAVTVIATMSIYIWQPGWPHSVARIPLWPRALPFAAFLTFISFRANGSVARVVFGTLALAVYLWLEYITIVFASNLVRGRFEPLLDYPVVALFWVFWNAPVLLAFAACQSLRLIVDWMRRT